MFRTGKCAALIFFALTNVSLAAEPQRPNVLLIMVDDLKPTLGCYSDTTAQTPNIDGLANRGMRFDLAYCNQAVCAPSRFTLMLGSHSTSTGLYGLGSHLRKILPDAVTMPQYFAKHGYRTESLGKVFHIGHGNLGDPNSFSVPHFKEKVIEYVDPASTQGGQLTREEAYFSNQQLDRINSLPRGAAFESPDCDDEAYADGRVAAETIRRLQSAKQRRDSDGTPFFVVAGFARPHLPFSAPKKYWDQYDPADLPMPAHEDLPEGAPRVAGKRGGEIRNYFPVPDKRDPAQISDATKRKLIHGYYASTSFVDAQIGKVIDSLENLELTDNTIVVLWGDHGFHLGDLGIWTKHTNYEQANRIPILISAPGVTKPGSSTKQLAESVDIFPTLAELAGLPVPTGPQPIDGLSLVPVLKDGQTRIRDHAYHAYPNRTLGRSIRTERYRMVQWLGIRAAENTAKYELYDYLADPLETRNLAVEKPDVLAQLQQMLAKYPQPVDHDGRRHPRAKPQPDSGEVSADNPLKTPNIARRPLTVSGHVKTQDPTGVVVAQGGRQFGYAIHLDQGRLHFDVRINGVPTRISAKDFAPEQFRFKASLTAHRLTLSIDDQQVASGKSPGLIPVQPQDGFSVGRDDLTAAGDYASPNELDGTITQVNVAIGKSNPARRPFQSQLITRWGESVTPQNAWTEYPRPQLKRDNWTNLNGNWDYVVTPIKRSKPPRKWAGKILVPFSLESKLGGVERLLDASQALWYRRTFTVEQSETKRQLLNFEAVDYSCEAFVNGKSVGTHVGGNTPFSFDVSHAIQDGDNELVVRVEDATEAYQLRGKQVLNARGIWYTQVSGIWQTVWLEEVPEVYAERVKVATKISGDVAIEVTPSVSSTDELNVLAIARLDGQEVARSAGSATDLQLKIANPQLWSPASPVLYDLELRVNDDVVHSYFGIREVGKIKDANGHWRFTLNGQEIFHWGPLDQGWWPDGLLTPPSDEAMLFDIEWLKSAGFNMIRKHIKVEPRRYYYHCDRLGMMLWQDHVSGGTEDTWPEWTRLKSNPVDSTWPTQQHDQFMLELDRMITTLESHPSIVSWVPFNERWGQHKTMEVGKWTVERDPSRLVNVASGGNFWPVGDVVDAHKYPHPEFPTGDGAGGRFDDYIQVMGEFGGHGLPVKGHLWDAGRRNWGYGDLPENAAEYKQRYIKSIQMLNDLRDSGIAAGVYTQTTDVEGEINGLMTYDRKVIKIPAKDLAQLHKILFSETPKQAAKADQFPNAAFREVPTDRKPGPVMDAETIRAGLKSHDRALFIKSGWIRDPYITLGPDQFYYLTGTQPREDDSRESANPYNIGLGDASIVGDQVRVYRSQDLISWESLGAVFSIDDTLFANRQGNKPPAIWAPEVHWMPELGPSGRWALVHCPRQVASLALSAGPKLSGPWSHPMGKSLGQRHDPSLFTAPDGTTSLLWHNTLVAPLNKSLTQYTGKPVRIDPAGTRPGPNGKPIRRIGHEGATMMQVGDKYVHLGTAWSTDRGRKGSYNLYYSVADQIAGPYGPRKFAGRFLGHGTPFQTRDGLWWCTAFFNANLPPLTRDGIQSRDLSENAQTINEQGVTIVPLDVRTLDSGEVIIRAKDPAYASPGPDEAQAFASANIAS